MPYLPNKEATCSIFGSTTFQSFDDRYYTFNGKCSYKIAGDCKDNTFSIHFKPDPQCSTGESYYCRHHVAMYMAGKEVKLMTKNLISVNNNSVSLPFSNGSIEISRLEGTNFISFSGWRGVKLLWDEYSIYVQLMPIYANKTCGLCGNYNGNPIDDMNDINSMPVKTVEKFVDGWKRLQFGESCPPAHSSSLLFSNSVESESIDHAVENYTNTVCSVLQSESFAPCHQAVPIAEYVSACKSQVKRCPPSFISNKNCSVCNVLQGYSRACTLKAIVLDWRNDQLCCEFHCLLVL